MRKEDGRVGEEERRVEKPLDLPDTEQKEQEIQDQQQQSSEQLDKKQNQKASENRKKGRRENEANGLPDEEQHAERPAGTTRG
ncbi:MAG: hypothetical protein IPL77_03425, partial [Flavobacteriales bacterium]|nr:hypothetical protein [Flavobacteriales bacterium]